MRIVRHLCLAAVVASGVFGPLAAQAQYYDDDYAPPPRRVYRDRGYDAPPPRGGLNCAAVQQGFTGPAPYSCPLPGPRPLGARCFCDLPLAPLSSPQTAVGRVVP